ncbi:MAG: rhodanese-like domain-containing protein [Minisyncoccota bacterium]
MKEINPTEAQELINKGGLTVIDVRTQSEYAMGHIADSTNINIADPAFLNRVTAIDKEATCLVYCGSGGRSSRAGALMTEQGFKNVHNLSGGIAAWKRAGFSTEG